MAKTDYAKLDELIDSLAKASVQLADASARIAELLRQIDGAA